MNKRGQGRGRGGGGEGRGAGGGTFQNMRGTYKSSKGTNLTIEAIRHPFLYINLVVLKWGPKP